MSVRLFLAEDTEHVRKMLVDQPVILYSAFVDTAVQSKAREVGVAVCIPKTSGVEALAREITAVAMGLA